jgi:Zn-dependent protease
MNINWLLVITLVPVLIFSMTFHELAHALVAYRLGDPTAKSMGRLTLNPLRHLDPIGTLMFFITAAIPGGFIFGWAKPVPISPYFFRNRRWGMALVGIAGPATNFVLAVVFAVILNLLEPKLGLVDTGGVKGWVFDLLFLAMRVNVVLGVFNLIPIPPLDGSRILGAFIPRRFYAQWAMLDRYGFFIIIALLVVVNYSGTGNWIASGEAGLWRIMLPAYT